MSSVEDKTDVKCCECENCQCGENCECNHPDQCCCPKEETTTVVETTTTEETQVETEEEAVEPVDDNPMLKEFAKRVYDKLQEDFFNHYPNITRESLFALVRISMEEAEKFDELEGKQKKELVLRVLQEAIKDHTYDDVQSEEVKFFVDKMADILIDNLVEVDLGNLHINEGQKKKFKNFFKKLCPCVKVD